MCASAETDRAPIRALCHILAYIGDEARRDNRPLPVIETDIETAHVLERMLQAELSPDIGLPRDHPERTFGVIAMFDGVKIVGRRKHA